MFKNKAIEALITSNFNRIVQDERLKEVYVEFDSSIGNMAIFNSVIYSSSTLIGGAEDIITKFEIRINNNDPRYEGTNSIDTNDIAELAKAQHIKELHDKKVSYSHAIRTAPDEFTYFLIKDGEREETSFKLEIAEISREIFR